MDNNVKTWLYDILTSINEIESYYIYSPKKFEIYQNDLKTKRAVERNIEIICRTRRKGFLSKNRVC